MGRILGSENNLHRKRTNADNDSSCRGSRGCEEHKTQVQESKIEGNRQVMEEKSNNGIWVRKREGKTVRVRTERIT